MILGFTTGKLDTLSYQEKIEFFQKLGCNALEVGGLHFERFPLFTETFEKVNYNKFSYRSFHAPCRKNGERIIYQNDQPTREILDEISALHKMISFSLIVLHPDQVKDWGVFADYQLPWAIENMDNRKASCKTVADIKNIFQKFDGKLVVDVNHCFSNDPTMKLATDFFREFDNKIAEVHLAGFAGYHEPLFLTKQDFIMAAITKKNIPIIIESVCNTKEEYEQEYNYVKDYIYRHP